MFKRTAYIISLIFGILWIFGGLNAAARSHLDASGYLTSFVPGVTILLALLLARKWDVIGAGLLLLSGMAFLVFILVNVASYPTIYFIMMFFCLVLPCLVSGVLIILNWREQRLGID